MKWVGFKHYNSTTDTIMRSFVWLDEREMMVYRNCVRYAECVLDVNEGKWLKHRYQEDYNVVEEYDQCMLVNAPIKTLEELAKDVKDFYGDWVENDTNRHSGHNGSDSNGLMRGWMGVEKWRRSRRR